MFNRNKDEREGILAGMGEGGHETVIGPSVKVDGDFVGDGNVLVQGVVNGTLKTKGNLRVEKGARVKADVEAQNAVIDGAIKGNVTIQDNLQIGATAILEGDIVTKVISVEPGATLNGHCLVAMTEKGEPVQYAPAKKGKPAEITIGE